MEKKKNPLRCKYQGVMGKIVSPLDQNRLPFGEGKKPPNPAVFYQNALKCLTFGVGEGWGFYRDGDRVYDSKRKNRSDIMKDRHVV